MTLFVPQKPSETVESKVCCGIEDEICYKKVRDEVILTYFSNSS